MPRQNVSEFVDQNVDRLVFGQITVDADYEPSPVEPAVSVELLGNLQTPDGDRMFDGKALFQVSDGFPVGLHMAM